MMLFNCLQNSPLIPISSIIGGSHYEEISKVLVPSALKLESALNMHLIYEEISKVLVPSALKLESALNMHHVAYVKLLKYKFHALPLKFLLHLLYIN